MQAEWSLRTQLEESGLTFHAEEASPIEVLETEEVRWNVFKAGIQEERWAAGEIQGLGFCPISHGSPLKDV